MLWQGLWAVGNIHGIFFCCTAIKPPHFIKASGRSRGYIQSRHLQPVLHGLHHAEAPQNVLHGNVATLGNVNSSLSPPPSNWSIESNCTAQTSQDSTFQNVEWESHLVALAHKLHEMEISLVLWERWLDWKNKRALNTFLVSFYLPVHWQRER